MGGAPVASTRFGNYTFSAVIGGLFPLLSFQVHGMPREVHNGKQAKLMSISRHCYFLLVLWSLPRKKSWCLSMAEGRVPLTNGRKRPTRTNSTLGIHGSWAELWWPASTSSWDPCCNCRLWPGAGFPYGYGHAFHGGNHVHGILREVHNGQQADVYLKALLFLIGTLVDCE
ncbi:hypothetical protein ZIOFF_042792 [Zingiber officinale]|uniref:Uncharacterized protein n=1 Tax=Zingiber officinale TaxID=94328 RepID=A0A8J5G9T2_ZINOF|nr:hypothetical protein ZIOFF_042792 [Zingiber officinale]